MPKILSYLTHIAICFLFFFVCGIQSPAQADVPDNEKSISAETETNPAITRRRRNRVAPAAEGSYQDERKSVRSWLLKAKKRGVGIKGYLNVYNDMEDSVRAGESDEVVKGKLDRLIGSIGDQYQQSRSLKSPSRKISKKGYSQAHNRGKVDLTFGKSRYWTPHEVKQSCEEAERQAILRIPRHRRGDLGVLQDLRRQRDEREKALMRKHGFKERGFTKNPYRFRNNGQFGAGNYGTYRYGTR